PSISHPFPYTTLFRSVRSLPHLRRLNGIEERQIVHRRRERNPHPVRRGIADLRHGDRPPHEAIAERQHPARRRVLLVTHLERVLDRKSTRLNSSHVKI